MRISSRTPEGWQGFCRICNHEVVMEPALPSGDATCPYCGSLVWFNIEPIGPTAQTTVIRRTLAFRAGALVRRAIKAIGSLAGVAKLCTAAAFLALLLAAMLTAAIVTRDFIALGIVVGTAVTGSAILYGRDRHRAARN